MLDYHLTKMRRINKDLHAKFIDPSRYYISARRAYRSIELWVEKDSIRNFLGNLAARHRVSIQVLRGFASLSMYRKALSRAAKSGVKKILYIGDFDPSGLLIEKVAENEMDIAITRIALTFEQIKRFKPPSRPVNKRDSRARDYIANYGNRCWEVEALKPRTLTRLVKEKLRENVPLKYLEEARNWEQAARISREMTEKIRRKIEREAFRLLEKRKSNVQILSQLTSKYDLHTRKRKCRRDN